MDVNINPVNSSTTEVSEHVPMNIEHISMFTTSSSRIIEKKHHVYGGNDSIKNFYESLRQLAMKIINFKKKKNGVINKRAAGII